MTCTIKANKHGLTIIRFDHNGSAITVARDGWIDAYVKGGSVICHTRKLAEAVLAIQNHAEPVTL